MKKAAVTVLKILVFSTGWVVLSQVIDFLIDFSHDNPAIWRFFSELIIFAVLLLFTVVFLLIEKGTVKIPITENLSKGAAVGTLTGFIWLGVPLAILIAANQLAITGNNEVSSLLLWIITAFINAAMQELLVRGYIYQLLRTRYSLPLAVIVTTAAFTLLHFEAFEGFLSVINILTTSLFITALYESEKTILAPIIAHAVWNIIGAIIFGCVRLAGDFPSLLDMTPSANAMLSGGEGRILEGSIVVTVMNILLMMVFLYRCRKGHARLDHEK